ncbi:hypothetical protein TWF694_006897 [Orbilia ellipsospora]|uniref:Uncharacterized protein n=1 Tax=Orbilia ellipsospora TaxID=2528407 RepID=A0AAV9XLG3_9PEZI
MGTAAWPIGWQEAEVQTLEDHKRVYFVDAKLPEGEILRPQKRVSPSRSADIGGTQEQGMTGMDRDWTGDGTCVWTGAPLWETHLAAAGKGKSCTLSAGELEKPQLKSNRIESGDPPKAIIARWWLTQLIHLPSPPHPLH